MLIPCVDKEILLSRINFEVHCYNSSLTYV